MKITYKIDSLGRVMIPAHMRKMLDMEKESFVTLEIDGTGIKIRKAQEKCAICGKQVRTEKASRTAAGSAICSACAKIIGGNHGNH